MCLRVDAFCVRFYLSTCTLVGCISALVLSVPPSVLVCLLVVSVFVCYRLLSSVSRLPLLSHLFVFVCVSVFVPVRVRACACVCVRASVRLCLCLCAVSVVCVPAHVCLLFFFSCLFLVCLFVFCSGPF